MAKLCFVCNKGTREWRQNLSELKLNHSKATVSSLLNIFLQDVEHRRNVDDSSNCICGECFEAFDEYDCIREMTRLKEQQLRTLFLTTEMLFMNDNGKKENCQTADVGEFEKTQVDSRCFCDKKSF